MHDTPNNLDNEPRRTASAKFVLKQDESSGQDLRDAMNTAHLSLAASLQLSFRALQAVMFLLIALYLVSGFKTANIFSLPSLGVRFDGFNIQL